MKTAICHPDRPLKGRGLCAYDFKRGRLAIDADHGTDHAKRGLLCHVCHPPRRAKSASA